MIRGQQTGRATEEKGFDKEAELMFVDRKDRARSRCLIVEPTHSGTFRNTGKKGFCGQWWVTEMVSPGLKRRDTETVTCSVNLNAGYMEE